MKSFKQFLTESQITEGKQEYLKKYSSEPDVKTVIDNFWIIRQRLKNPENDIDYWIKKPFSELKQFVLNFDTSKNKKVRQQDRYVKDAEKWGAIMFGNFGPYEAWFVPTYEAAVQLGRFYKNVSTKWCISTDEPEYFNEKYHNYEFVFLVSDDKSLKEKQKLALQIDPDTFKLKGVWNILDKNIINRLKQYEKTINSVLPKFKKLNRSRNDNITKTIINRNEEELRKNSNQIVNNIFKKIKTIKENTINYKYKKYLTNIVIPNNITTIDYNAFCNCESLKQVVIPNSVTSIDDGAFSWCKSLTSITIPDSVTSIGDEVFSHCYSLTSIVIPNSITSISDMAFSWCKSLKEITIPNSVTSIGYEAFSSCESLETITIPNSVTSIGDEAFSSCESLKEIAIPDRVTSIGDYAFSDCESLTSITIPNSVTSICDGTFYNCELLKEITIPNSVKSIGAWAFGYCKSLTSIIIPNSVTSIDDGAFSWCKSLTSITIPDSVISIDESAFVYCELLTKVIFSSNSPLLNDIKNGEYEKWDVSLEQIFIKK